MAINRALNFFYISERLSTLSTLVKMSGKINVLLFHNHSENFYQYFFKILYDWDLVDLNTDQKSEEAIDLFCEDKKLIVQVSATATKSKIEDSIKKLNISKYSGYKFVFISITEDVKDLRKKTFSNPQEIIFDPNVDIYDIARILSDIKKFSIIKQEETKEFLIKELGMAGQTKPLDLNLTKIINILSKQNLSETESAITIKGFNIDEKIEFNNLVEIKDVINEFAAYQPKLDKIYTEFDSQGFNKSTSILSLMKSEYIKCRKNSKNEELFYLIFDRLKSKIIESKNFLDTEEEILDMCLYIIMVDSFVRCKIFENPSNYKYAPTR